MKKKFDCVEMQRKLRGNINRQYGKDHKRLIHDLGREVGFEKKDLFGEKSRPR